MQPTQRSTRCQLTLPLLLLSVTLAPLPLSAANECGTDLEVTCTGNHSATGITYDFSTDLTMTTGASLLVGANGLRLNGIGGANLSLTVPTRAISGAGGVNITMGTGHVTGHFDGAGAIATPLAISGDGGATITLGSTVNPTFSNNKLAHFIGDIGGVSSITTTTKRTVTLMTLNARTGGKMTVNNGGIIGDTADPVLNSIVLRGSGAGDLVINNTVPRGRIRGNFDLSAMTGSFTLLNDNSGRSRQGGWHSWGLSTFAGDVEVLNGTRGVIRTVGETTFDFSASSSSKFVNEGRLMMGTQLSGMTPLGPLTLRGLDRFENSGLILLGTSYNYDPDPGVESDRLAKDRLVIEDGSFVGSGASRIALDATLAGVTQADCSAVTSSDCVSFVGASTSGQTLLTVNDAKPFMGYAAFNTGMVLIDGSSAAEHFVLDPESQYYVPHMSGGVGLQKGLVAYRFSYDADAKQHKLIGTLADEGVQASTHTASAQEVWRTTTESWFDRRDALRRDEGGGFDTHGFWASLNVANGERDLQRTLAINGSDTDYDLGQELQTHHLAFGVDVLRGSSGDRAWNLGITAGYVYSTIDYDATRLEATLAGFASGIYGSWLSGPLSIDAMVNLNMLTQSIDAKNTGLGKNARLRAAVDSLGARVDAGWKIAVTESFWLQPLLGVSYVSTSIEGIEPEEGGPAIQFEDGSSARLGLGLRTGIDARLFGAKAQYNLTGRWWNDFAAENESSAYIPNGDSTVALEDDFGGSFGEIAAGLNLSNDSGLLSGYVNIKSKMASDYSNLGASAGVRFQW
jgi:hypothetical protein